MNCSSTALLPRGAYAIPAAAVFARQAPLAYIDSAVGSDAAAVGMHAMARPVATRSSQSSCHLLALPAEHYRQRHARHRPHLPPCPTALLTHRRSANPRPFRPCRYGLLNESQDKLDYVLALTPADFLERRLQTLVFKQGLAKSIHHARVLIRQRHIRCAAMPLASNHVVRHFSSCRNCSCGLPYQYRRVW